jgi:hypothetical protein
MSFDQGYALVIGVGTHKHSPWNDVPITVRDAEAVEAILADPTKCGYPSKQVWSLSKEKATRNAILTKLDQLATKVTQDSTVLVFFAGHGALGSDDQYYLVTHDAQFVDSGDEVLVKQGTGISQVEMLAKLRAIKAKRAILIFNACHSGNLQPKSLALRKAAQKPLNTLSLPDPTAAALLGTGEGRIIITACRPDQLSHFLEKNKLTYFTKALTDGLSGKAPPRKGFISAFSLYEYVHDAVTEQVSEQEPMITVLQTVGSFAVALYQKKGGTLGLEAADSLPEGKGVRVVSKTESQKWRKKIENQTIVRGDYIKGDKVLGNKIGKQINTGGGAYVGGNVSVSGGSFVGRNQTVYNAGGGGSPQAADRLSPLSQRLCAVLSDKSFTQAELTDLCISLDIEWSDLDGGTKANKVRALVAECERAGKTDQLRSMIRLARPKLKDQL